MNELVTASAGLTPADITQAAGTVAQQMFEQALDTGQRQHPSTGDYVRAISALRPTLTPEIVREFTDDIEAMSRA